MALISKSEINEIAYLIAIPEDDFKDSVISTVQEVDLRSILTAPLYDALIADPASYVQLLNDYCKPYMAHRIKELTMALQKSEDPTTSTRASEIVDADVKYQADIAGQHYQNLNLYIARTYSIGARWVSGIIIDEIEAPPPPIVDPPIDPAPPVPQHGHNCDDIFLPDPNNPPDLINLCNWANGVEDRLLIDYFYNSADNVVIDSETYLPVVSLLTPDIPAGTYEFKLAFTWSLNAATRSMYFQFSLDGGTSWTEWVSEPKDSTDDIPFSYFFPFAHPGGILDCRLESRLENAADNGLISFSDIIIDRKS